MDFKVLLVSLFCLCVTADQFCRGFGKCVLLSKCEPLRSLLQRSKGNRYVSNMLRKKICGFENMESKVCCPSPRHTFTEIINGSNCVTASGEVGTCTKLEECGFMNEKLQTKGFIHAETMEYVKRSKRTNEIEYEIDCDWTEPSYLQCRVFSSEYRDCTPPGSTKSFYVCCKSDVESQRVSPPPEPEDSRCVLSAFPPQPGSKCCGIESSGDPRIIGGKEAGIDQFPWLVMIEYTRIGYSCGGSLISGRYVLTAAHCLVGSNGKSREAVSVRLGEYNTTNPGSDCIEVPGGGVDCTDGDISILIESYVVHDGYVAEKILKYHDIALIRLKEMANFTDFIRPICLPTTDFSISPPDDLKLFIAGWGVSDEVQELSSNIKLFAEVPYVKKEQCNERFLKFGRQPLIDTQLCVGGEAKRDSCKGDSGGPLMLLKNVTYEAAGVISFGMKYCGLLNWPSIYTKVYGYLDWIRDIIKP